MKLSEMEYKNTKERHLTILAKGIEGKFQWFIVSLGSHPCCYIILPEGHKYYRKDYDDIPLECHGGLTFAGKDMHFNPIVMDGWIIGWDYAHAGDYYAGMVPLDSVERKYTTDVLIGEVMDVIKQLEV